MNRTVLLSIVILLIFLPVALVVGCQQQPAPSLTPPTPAPTTPPTPTPTPSPIPTPSQPSPSPSPCPSGSPPAKIAYYGHLGRSWNRIPDITVSARAGDPRIQMVEEAVDWWNQQLTAIGSPFRLGSITHTTELVPADYLQEYSSAGMQGKPSPEPPEILQNMPGDLIIALSDGMFISFATYPRSGTSLIAIRNSEVPPLSLTNVTRNVIAHELGHAVGLGHHNDPTKLMCGRPAECRPAGYHCDIEQFFSVTDDEKAYLLEQYPLNWKPRP
ncbi:hypothetical protein ACFLYR_09760 [Chloroflexota bacterium]